MNHKSAILSECGRYRYRLERFFGEVGLTYAFFGVNPSTADANVDDATVRKWTGFAKRNGGCGFIVGNVFAYRSTDVRALSDCDDAVGPENSNHLFRIACDADVLVPCWGNVTKVPKELRGQFNILLCRLARFDKPIRCLGLTKSGAPRHPLMLGYETPFSTFPFTTEEED